MMKIISGDTEYKFGIITGFVDSFSKSVTTTPIVSMPTDSTFPLETGASLSYEVSFARTSPKDFDDNSADSDRWCNSTWVERVCTLSNRWQARTDGYRMVYEDLDENGQQNPYTPRLEERVYIKRLSIVCDPGHSDYLSGSIQLRVGSARTGADRPTVDRNASPESLMVDAKSAYVVLTSPNNSKQYLLHFSSPDASADSADFQETANYGIDCINSYTVNGGPGIPFENIQLKVSRKKLTELYPELGAAADSTFETDILAGKSTVIYKGVGMGTMTVSSCKMTSDEYTITAYCKEEILRGTPIGGVSASYSPKEFIEYALSGTYGVVCNTVFKVKENVTSANLEFKNTTTVWQALQICAAALNSKIFFANGKAYVIDYSIGPNTYDRIELYPKGSEKGLHKAVVGQASYGNEGQDTIINLQLVKVSAEPPKSSMNNGSILTYSTKEGPQIDLSKYLTIESDAQLADAESVADLIGKHIVDYCGEPQKSITFKVRENYSESGYGTWAPMFETFCCVGVISSSVDGITISNRSVVKNVDKDTVVPQKLYLSQYARRYPERTAEYTFGEISNMDLQSTLSKIQNG